MISDTGLVIQLEDKEPLNSLLKEIKCICHQTTADQLVLTQFKCGFLLSLTYTKFPLNLIHAFLSICRIMSENYGVNDGPGHLIPWSFS